MSSRFSSSCGIDHSLIQLAQGALEKIPDVGAALITEALPAPINRL